MPAWGFSRISAADQTRFFLGIDRFVVRRHRGTAMRLLNTIVGPQRWGIARARPRGWALYFKGGWGVGRRARWTIRWRCCAAASAGSRVAILTTGNPGHEYGKTTLEGVARRLLRRLRPGSVVR